MSMAQNTSSYFDARGISPKTYANYKLATYVQNALPPVEEGPNILEIGCGYGQLLRALEERGYSKARGIDIDEKAVVYCNSAGSEVYKVQSIPDYAGDNRGKYDCILMSHILEHLKKDEIIPSLQAVRSMLTKNGWLLLMVPNAQSNTGCYWAYEDFTHNTLFTSGSVLYVLKMAGFTDIEFIDITCTEGLTWPKKVLRLAFLKIYMIQRRFWNMVTCSAYHAPSPLILSYEIKVRAR
jgi:2-polyprenyl-3-methyl-5-hydroxy-6-metoxy-1,4-benzoquinol methylase